MNVKTLRPRGIQGGEVANLAIFLSEEPLQPLAGFRQARDLGLLVDELLAVVVFEILQ